MQCTYAGPKDDLQVRWRRSELSTSLTAMHNLRPRRADVPQADTCASQQLRHSVSASASRLELPANADSQQDV